MEPGEKQASPSARPIDLIAAAITAVILVVTTAWLVILLF